MAKSPVAVPADSGEDAPPYPLIIGVLVLGTIIGVMASVIPGCGATRVDVLDAFTVE